MKTATVLPFKLIEGRRNKYQEFAALLCMDIDSCVALLRGNPEDVDEVVSALEGWKDRMMADEDFRRRRFTTFKNSLHTPSATRYFLLDNM